MMVFLFDVGSIDWKLYVAGAVGIIALTIFIAIMINKGRYTARYKRFYKKLDRIINKKYNGNLLNEALINTMVKDNTNTYKSLKAKGKRKVRKYFEYYIKNLPELVLLKSLSSSDKKKNQLVLLFLNDMDKVIFRWDARRKMRGLIKGINKHQMLFTVIGYFYEVPIHIHEGVPFRMMNHDNNLAISYDIVKNPKNIKRKQKPKKLTKKEIKAQAKIEAIKEKRQRKAKR
jgi:hypothetical protein